MEQLHKRARKGLMAAPRVGMGVGGLLLGSRQNTSFRLLDSIEIPCSHSGGPSFNLTPDEKQETTKLIAGAGPPGITGKISVVGWYCSKTRGEPVLSESDLSLYAELFPATDLVVLVVRPSLAEPMRAAFFYRDKNGSVVKGVECEVDEWGLAPGAGLETLAADAPEPAPDLPDYSAPIPVTLASVTPPRVPKAPPPVLPTAPVTNKASDAPKLVETKPPAALPRRPELSAAPRFAAFEPRPVNKARLALLSAAALVVAGVTAFVTQDYWMPRPPLSLTSTVLNGSLLIHWDPAALRGIEHASMFVNDGGQTAPSVIPLDRFELRSGILSYTPKSKRVTAKLDAGETSAILAWFAPPPAAAPAAPDPGEASASPKDRKPGE